MIPPRSFHPLDQGLAESSAFAALGLHDALLRALADEGYVEPTPVQAEVIPHALAGRDVLACARTGSGKTAAFVLPILQRLAMAKGNGAVRALVLAPTRELASQIGERVSTYGRDLQVRHKVIFGGVRQRPQEIALRNSPDVLIATPGRLLDLMHRGFVRIDSATCFVLDAAERMLELGLLPDVRRIAAALPQARQTLLFTAAVSAPVDELARDLLVEPERVSIQPDIAAAEPAEPAERSASFSTRPMGFAWGGLAS